MVCRFLLTLLLSSCLTLCACSNVSLTDSESFSNPQNVAAHCPIAKTRDAYVLGAGLMEKQLESWAFVFLLTKFYRTVYVNDLKPLSTTLQAAYNALCPSGASTTQLTSEGALDFCFLVPALPKKAINTQHMGVPAATILSETTNGLFDVDIFVTSPSPGWFYRSEDSSAPTDSNAALTSSLSEDLQHLLGFNSVAYVFTAYDLNHSRGPAFNLTNLYSELVPLDYYSRGMQIAETNQDYWEFRHPRLDAEIPILTSYNVGFTHQLYRFTAADLAR